MNDYFDDIFLDADIEVYGPLQCTYEQTHPQLKRALETFAHDLVFNSV